MSTNNLEAPCPVCQRRSGGHTLDEWAQCIAGSETHHLPYEDVPNDVQALLQERFPNLEGQLIVDNVVARAGYLESAVGAIPLLMLEFGVNSPSGVQVQANVAFLAPAATMRKAGTIIRDAANGAANRVEPCR